MRDVTLKQRELARLHVLSNVLEFRIPIAQAAEILGVSERHTRRLLTAYRRDGAAALAHGNRGRRPHNAIPDSQAAAVVQLAGTHYAGTIHTHLTELLQEHDGIDLSRPTVRRILANAGIGSPRIRRPHSNRVLRRRMPPGGDALADRRQPSPLVRGERAEVYTAADGGRCHRYRGWQNGIHGHGERWRIDVQFHGNAEHLRTSDGPGRREQFRRAPQLHVLHERRNRLLHVQPQRNPARSHLFCAASPSTWT